MPKLFTTQTYLLSRLFHRTVLSTLTLWIFGAPIWSATGVPPGTPALQAIVRVNTITGSQNIVSVTPNYRSCNCTTLLISPDGKTIYTTDEFAESIIARDAQTGEKIREFKTQWPVYQTLTVEYTYPFALSPDGSLLLVGTCGDEDGLNDCAYSVLEVYDTSSGKLLGTVSLADSEEVITTIAVSLDNQTAYVTNMFENFGGSPPKSEAGRAGGTLVTDGITAISLSTYSPTNNLNIEPYIGTLVANDSIGYTVTAAGLEAIWLPSLSIFATQQEEYPTIALADRGSIVCAYEFDTVDCYQAGTLSPIGTITNSELEGTAYDEGGFAGDPNQPYLYIGGSLKDLYPVLYKVDARTMAIVGMFPTSNIESIAAGGDGIVYMVVDNYQAVAGPI